MATLFNRTGKDYREFLENVIYESSDNGKTIKIKRRWDFSNRRSSEHQLLDLLDILHYSKTDPSLKDLVDQIFMYFTLKYKGETDENS
jgi:hypothetical protein